MSSASARRPKSSLKSQGDDFSTFKSQKGKQRANILGTRPAVDPTSTTKSDIKEHTNSKPSTDATATITTSNTTPLPAATSRLCIKNLPAQLNETQLQQHLSKHTTTIITDCRIMHTPDGRSRKFAFIGYQSPAMATSALNYFNNTYIGSSKISVSYAIEKGAAQIAERPWSKYSEGSSRYQHAHEQQDQSSTNTTQEEEKIASEVASASTSATAAPKKGKVTSLLSSILSADRAAMLASDPKFQDYLHIMGGKGQNKFWENDEKSMTAAVNDSTMVGGSVNDAEERERVRLLKELDADDDDDDTFNNPSVSEHPAEGEGKDASRMSDAEYMKARQTAFGDDDVDADADDADDSIEEKKDTTSVPEIDECRLFVRNLPYNITEENIISHFSRYGPLEAVHLPIVIPPPIDGVDGMHQTQHQYQHNKGFAFVTYSDAAAAAEAMQQLNGKTVMGRIIQILPSHKRPTATAASAPAATASMTYKKQKEIQRHKDAADDSHWNTLFISPDTVISAISAQMNIDKSQLMNTDDEALAVRMALAETHLLTQTKAWLAQEGIDVSVLHRDRTATSASATGAARSKRLIMIKNIPYDSDINELRSMFSKYGSIARLLMPPSKAMCMIEFQDDIGASKAFLNLAYKKYHHSPLYLEWAPLGLLKPLTAQHTQTTPMSTESVLDTVHAAMNSPTITNTVYVKNLNFDTTENTLRTIFSKVAAVRSVTIAKKKAPVGKGAKAGGESGVRVMLSMGYAFVELHSSDDVGLIVAAMNGKEVEGHILEVRPSTRSVPSSMMTDTAITTNDADATATIPSSRLIVKNLAFETSSTELRRLFSAFGVVSRIRLPKKFDGSHRGFAFVDMVSKQEAANVRERLKDSHLYGRRLTIEYTDEREEEFEEDDGGVDSIVNRVEREKKLAAKREKVKRQYEASQSDLPQHKKSKKARVDVDEGFME